MSITPHVQSTKLTHASHAFSITAETKRSFRTDEGSPLIELTVSNLKIVQILVNYTSG